DVLEIGAAHPIVFVMTHQNVYGAIRFLPRCSGKVGYMERLLLVDTMIEYEDRLSCDVHSGHAGNRFSQHRRIECAGGVRRSKRQCKWGTGKERHSYHAASPVAFTKPGIRIHLSARSGQIVSCVTEPDSMGVILRTRAPVTAAARARAHKTMTGVAELLKRIRANGALRHAPRDFVAALMNSLAEATMSWLYATLPAFRNVSAAS